MESEEILALDVGSQRIGVARASLIAKIPEALPTIEVDGHEVESIGNLAKTFNVKKLVIGLPRNLSGEETAQTKVVRQFAAKLEDYEIVWQDESLTSVNAEAELQITGKKYAKGDIDAGAAVNILRDYLERI